MRPKATWRAPELGTAKELDLAQGTIRYYDGGSGPTIVFVHGLCINANVWRKVFTRLTGDFRCVVLDLPFGSHQVPMKPDADLSEKGIVNLIADAIEALDLEDVTLVGMDTGGAVCQFVVTQRPERIGRLVLCSCDYRDNFPPTILSHLKLVPYTPLFLIPILFAPFRLRVVRRLPNGFGRLSKRPVERVVEDSWALPSLDDRRIRRDLAKVCRIFDKRRLNETADRLSTFERPALIAWSADDKLFPPAHGEALARDLADARFELIDDAWALSMEEQPDRLAELIGQFVREPHGAAVHR